VLTKDPIPLGDEVFAFDIAEPFQLLEVCLVCRFASQLLRSEARVDYHDAFGDRRPSIDLAYTGHPATPKAATAAEPAMKSRRRMRPSKDHAYRGDNSTFWHGRACQENVYYRGDDVMRRPSAPGARCLPLAVPPISCRDGKKPSPGSGITVTAFRLVQVPVSQKGRDRWSSQSVKRMLTALLFACDAARSDGPWSRGDAWRGDVMRCEHWRW
jgi:hypothetical protein